MFRGDSATLLPFTSQRNYCDLHVGVPDVSVVQMGEALIRGFLSSGVASSRSLCASVRSEERRLAMEALGLRVFGNALHGGAAEVAAASDVIFLGVRSDLTPSPMQVHLRYLYAARFGITSQLGGGGGGSLVNILFLDFISAMHCLGDGQVHSYLALGLIR